MDESNVHQRPRRARAGGRRGLDFDANVGALLLFSLLFTLVFNFDWAAGFAGRDRIGPAYRFLVSLGYTFVCFTIFSLTRPTLVLLTPVATVLSAVAAYFVKTYKVQITENTLALLYETNLDEARGLISAELLLWVLASLAVAALLVVRLHRSPGSRQPWNRLQFAGATAILLLLCPRPMGLRALHMSLLPVSLLASSNVYFREQQVLGKLLQSRREVWREGAAHFNDQGLTVVLVIGEAARSANFHFNGYARATSPALDSAGPISFPDIYSCETNTRFAVPCLMTRGTEADLELPYRETSLVSVFRSLGFETTWLSNQAMFWSGSLVERKFTIAATAAIAEEAEHTLFVNRSGDIDFSAVRDENLIPPFEKALAGGVKNRLIVVHMAGSHWRYDSHYPEAFRKFTPTCGNNDPNRCTREEIRNSYDNTLLYTDFVVGELIRRVAGGKSIVFFVSDHGEALGENNRYLHHQASRDPNMRNAATFVWTSPAFAAAFPQKVAALRENRQRRLAHDNVFSSVLDCAGIEASYIDPALSFCRPGARERPPDPPDVENVVLKDRPAWQLSRPARLLSAGNRAAP
jgi:glucan phosphoethanolaminetransferase (alkaline phosphatase superfamily)